jgi:hypothetical protein
MLELLLVTVCFKRRRVVVKMLWKEQNETFWEASLKLSCVENRETRMFVCD